MHGFFSDDAEDIAVAGAESETLSNQHLRIPAADRLDVRVALVVDVADDHADLVDVTGQHDRRLAFAVYLGEAVAGDVAADFSEFFRLFTPHLRWRGFEA